MRAGRLDRRVKIKSQTQTRDSYGGLTRTFQVIAELWAGALPVAGTRLFEAAQFVDGAQIRFELRYREGLDKTMLIEHDGRDYQIIRIDEIGRRRGLYIWAKLP